MKLPTILRLATFALIVGGCGSNSGSSGVSTGSSGGPCYPNQTCNGGLVCVDTTCVSEPEWPDGAEAGPNEGGGGNLILVLSNTQCVSLPVDPYEVSGYGFGEQVGNQVHLGQDVHVTAGSPVRAVADGEIVYAHNHPPTVDTNGTVHGNWGGLVLQKVTQDGKTIILVYGHLDPDHLPPLGEMSKGDLLGQIATKAQTGYVPHLHMQSSTSEIGASVVPGYASTTDGWQAFSDWATLSMAACPSASALTDECDTPHSQGHRCIDLVDGSPSAPASACATLTSISSTCSSDINNTSIACASTGSVVPMCSRIRLIELAQIDTNQSMMFLWEFMFTSAELERLRGAPDSTVEWQLKGGVIKKFSTATTNLPGATVRDSRCDVFACDESANAVVTLCPADLQPNTKYNLTFYFDTEPGAKDLPPDSQSIFLDVIAGRSCDDGILNLCTCDAPSGDLSATQSWNCVEDVNARPGRVLEADTSGLPADQQTNTLAGLLSASKGGNALAVSPKDGVTTQPHNNYRFGYAGSLEVDCALGTGGAGGAGGAAGASGSSGTSGTSGSAGSTSCSDECILGQTRCSGASVQQTCANFDADSCTEWGGDITCANGCTGSICAGCANVCTAGTSRCVSATAKQTCGDYNADSCLEWGAQQTCTCEGSDCCTYSQSNACQSYTAASNSGTGGGEIFQICGDANETGLVTLQARKTSGTFGNRPYNVRVSGPSDPPCGPNNNSWFFQTVDNAQMTGVGTDTLTFTFTPPWAAGDDVKYYCVTASTQPGDVGYDSANNLQKSWWYSKKISIQKSCP